MGMDQTSIYLLKDDLIFIYIYIIIIYIHIVCIYIYNEHIYIVYIYVIIIYIYSVYIVCIYIPNIWIQIDQPIQPIASPRHLGHELQQGCLMPYPGCPVFSCQVYLRCTDARQIEMLISGLIMGLLWFNIWFNCLMISG